MICVVFKVGKMMVEWSSAYSHLFLSSFIKLFRKFGVILTPGVI